MKETNTKNEVLNNSSDTQSVLPDIRKTGDPEGLEGIDGNNQDRVVKYKRGHNPNSKKNLISLADRTKEERIEIGRKGGLKSGEKRQERRTMRETMLEMLSETISEDFITEYGLEKVLKNPQNKSYQDAIIGATVLGAISGDIRCVQMLRDTIGEMPVTKTENITEVITKEDTELMDNLKRSLIG